MNIFLANALDTLEFQSIGDFFRHYFTWAFWEKQLPVIGTFVGRVILAIVVYIIASKLIQKLSRFLVLSMKKASVDTGVIQFVSSVVKAALYCLLVISIATSFGVKESSIAALVASGGVAVGLALQGGLSNLAGGVIILLLKPFVVGDYIIENTDKQEGTVVRIDLFYTTLSTVDNKRITIPNGTLTSASIVNVTAQDKRQLDLKIQISTSGSEKSEGHLENTPHGNASILHDDGIQVFVDELAADGVVLGLRAWVGSADYWPTRWRLNEKIKLTFDEEGIELPFTQMDVHIKK